MFRSVLDSASHDAMSTPTETPPPLTAEARRNSLYAAECKRLCEELAAAIADTPSDFGTDSAVLSNIWNIRRHLTHAIDVQRRGVDVVKREREAEARWGTGVYQ